MEAVQLKCSNNAYKVTWHNGWDFNFLQHRREDRFETLVKIVTIQVQKARICLVCSNTGLQYVPYVYIGSVWQKVVKRDLKVEAVSPLIFESEESFKEGLERQMLLQFRTSMVGFYDDFPPRDEILQVLRAHPTMSRMRAMRYTFYKVKVQDDPEFDGAFEVYCKEGSLIVPYRNNEDGDATLIIKWANFRKNNDPESVLDRVGQKLDGISGFFGNIHWSNIRSKIEGVWN